MYGRHSREQRAFSAPFFILRLSELDRDILVHAARSTNRHSRSPSSAKRDREEHAAKTATVDGKFDLREGAWRLTWLHRTQELWIWARRRRHGRPCGLSLRHMRGYETDGHLLHFKSARSERTAWSKARVNALPAALGRAGRPPDFVRGSR